MKTQQELEILIKKFKALRDSKIKPSFELLFHCNRSIDFLNYIISNDAGDMQPFIDSVNCIKLK